MKKHVLGRGTLTTPNGEVFQVKDMAVTITDEPLQVKQWVVNVLGGPDGSYEISVLRNERTYAKHSYGWEGPDKIIVSGSGGPCQYKVPPSLFTKLVAVAEDFARELNESEKVK